MMTVFHTRTIINFGLCYPSLLESYSPGFQGFDFVGDFRLNFHSCLVSSFAYNIIQYNTIQYHTASQLQQSTMQAELVRIWIMNSLVLLLIQRGRICEPYSSHSMYGTSRILADKMFICWLTTWITVPQSGSRDYSRRADDTTSCWPICHFRSNNSFTVSHKSAIPQPHPIRYIGLGDGFKQRIKPRTEWFGSHVEGYHLTEPMLHHTL